MTRKELSLQKPMRRMAVKSRGKAYIAT